ncbi:MAG: tetratricopeptide repeat protein [Nitrospinota bacterium]
MKFKIASILVSIGLAATVCLFAPVSAQMDDYLFGLRALEDGHLDAAILAFETYLKDQPKGPRRAEARFFLAEAKSEQGATADALKEYRAFLATSSDHPFRSAAHFRVGRIELNNRRYEAAAEHFSRVKKGPLAGHALFYLGHVRFRLKQWDATVRVLSELLHKYPASPWAAPARYALGMAHYKKKEDASAVRFLEAYLKTAPPGRVESLWAKAVVGEIRKQQGRCGPAKAAFEAVLQGDPQFSGREAAAWGLAECLYEERAYGSAAGQYASYLKTYPTSPRATLARIRGGHSYLLSGRSEDALGLLRKAAKSEIPPDYGPWVPYWTARAEELSGKKSAALKTYESLVASHPESSQALDAAAKAAAMRFARKEFEPALKHLARLKGSDDPIRAAWAVRMTGEALFALGRYGEAFDSLSQALQRVPEETTRRAMVYMLAIAAFQTKKDQDALRYLTLWLGDGKGGLKREGDGGAPSRRLEALKMLGTVQTRLGLLNELAETWGRLEAETPDGAGGGAASQKAEFSANRGLVLFQLGEFSAAERQFQEWLIRYPSERNRAEVLLHLGLAQLRTGKNADAALRLDAFLKENPDHPRVPEALYASALGHLRGKDYPKAAERLAGWLNSVKDGAGSEQVKEAWFLLAGARFESADWKGAAAAYHQILKLFPQDKRRETVLQDLSRAYDRLSEQEGSDEALQWLEKHYPDRRIRAKVFLRLGKERLFRKEWARAGRYLQVAVQSPEPQVKGEGLYRLARAYIQQGMYQEALEAMSQIPKSVQEKAEWRADAEYLRGVAYEEEKEWEKAVKAYRGAARHSSSDSVARAALDRIAKIESLRWNQ